MWTILLRSKNLRSDSSHEAFDAKILTQPTFYDDDTKSCCHDRRHRRDLGHARLPRRVHNVNSLVRDSWIGWLEKMCAGEIPEMLIHLGSCNGHAMIYNLKARNVSKEYSSRLQVSQELLWRMHWYITDLVSSRATMTVSHGLCVAPYCSPDLLGNRADNHSVKKGKQKGLKQFLYWSSLVRKPIKLTHNQVIADISLNQSTISRYGTLYVTGGSHSCLLLS